MTAILPPPPPILAAPKPSGGRLISRSLRQGAQHQRARCNPYPYRAALRQCRIIFAQTPLPRPARYNLQAAAQPLPNPFRQCQPGAVTVLNIRRMRRYRQQPTRRTHHNITLAPRRFLPALLTAQSLFFGSFHRLFVANGSAGFRMAALYLPRLLAQGRVDLLPNLHQTPGAVAVKNVAAGRQVVRQHTPGRRRRAGYRGWR